MNSKKKGELTELNIVPKLYEKGYNISKPVTEDCRYDLVIEGQEGLERIQVKTSRYRNGVVEFNTADVRSNATSNRRKEYCKEQIDAFMTYNSETEEIYKVSVEEAPKTKMSLRVEKPNRSESNRINWSKDYRI